MAARKQPVPVAESQMNAKIAPSGVGLTTTGWLREILLWIGVVQPLTSFVTGLPSLSALVAYQCGVVWRLIQSLTGWRPQTNTKTERIRNGSHALNTWPVVWWALAAAAIAGSGSSSKRQIFLGFQKSRKSTVQSREKRPAVMSTR